MTGTQKLAAVQKDDGSCYVEWANGPRGMEEYGPYQTLAEAEADIPIIRARIDVRQAFAAAGVALYGNSWQRQMADEGLHINERTVRRILSGGSPLQDGHVAGIERLSRDRMAEIEAAIHKLKIAHAALKAIDCES